MPFPSLHLSLSRLLVPGLLMATALLGGCQVMHRSPGHEAVMLGADAAFGLEGLADPLRPRVAVVNGRVRLDQEVITFRQRGNTTIVWRMPEDSPWRFTPDGIRFDERAKGTIQCRFNAEKPREFSCLNTVARKDYFKYLIKVTDGLSTIERDPFVVNDVD